MAVINALPAETIIKALKGSLDYYIHRGTPCVRAWPRTTKASMTAASLAAATLFGEVVRAYALLDPAVLDAYQTAAKNTPRTARDIMVAGVYGKLHTLL